MPVDFVALFSVLNGAKVRFVVVGGLAVLLRGLDRLTADVDLVIDLSADSVKEAVRALTATGYHALAPVDPLELANADRRREWQSQRNMQVFSFWDSTGSRPTVDVILNPVVPFAELWTDATSMTLGGLKVRVASVPHLIRMKSATGRAQDMQDVERLKKLLPDIKES